MILVVDVGNSNICIGGYTEDKLLFKSRIKTDILKMRDEYAINIKSIISLYGYKSSDINGAIISSVVPPLIGTIKSAIQVAVSDGEDVQNEKIKIFTVGAGIKTGINIKTDNPSQLGTDLVCSATMAIDKYKTPCIIFDMGTATTITVIDGNKTLQGSVIMPGVKISLEALSARTSQLPQIEFGGKTPELVGKNTIMAMKSGAIYGFASMVDGMINRYQSVFGKDLTVVATGGLAKDIVCHCQNNIVYDDDIVLEGLRKIYYKNIRG